MLIVIVYRMKSYWRSHISGMELLLFSALFLYCQCSAMMILLIRKYFTVCDGGDDNYDNDHHNDGDDDDDDDWAERRS